MGEPELRRVYRPASVTISSPVFVSVFPRLSTTMASISIVPALSMEVKKKVGIEAKAVGVTRNTPVEALTKEVPAAARKLWAESAGLSKVIVPLLKKIGLSK